jgi:hypothetical protein
MHAYLLLRCPRSRTPWLDERLTPLRANTILRNLHVVMGQSATPGSGRLHGSSAGVLVHVAGAEKFRKSRPASPMAAHRVPLVSFPDLGGNCSGVPAVVNANRSSCWGGLPRLFVGGESHQTHAGTLSGQFVLGTSDTCFDNTFTSKFKANPRYASKMIETGLA